MTAAYFPFASVPSLVREEIFLLVSPADLSDCQRVSSSWRDFIESTVKRNRSFVEVTATRATVRRVLGKPVDLKAQQVDVSTQHMHVSYDESEKRLYVLSENDGSCYYTLRQYSCAVVAEAGVRELNAVTLLTRHSITRMQVVGGHLVLFKRPVPDSSSNEPAVFSLASIRWGGRLPIWAGMKLPGDSFHFTTTKLLLGRDSLYVVSQEAHAPGIVDSAHQSNSRAVVVHRLTRQSGYWQEYKIHPAHEFRITESQSYVYSRRHNPAYRYKDQTCHLHLTNDIITESYLLVSCPPHGSYEMFDYEHGVSMWKLNLAQLSAENMQSILREVREDSFNGRLIDHPVNKRESLLAFSQLFFFYDDAVVVDYPPLLAAIRRDYVFVYAERGLATLFSVREGTPLHQVEGRRFVLSPRYVLPIKHERDVTGWMPTLSMAVVDSVSGARSRSFSFRQRVVSTEATGDLDDHALRHFEVLAERLLSSGDGDLRWPLPAFQRESNNSVRGRGYIMLDSRRMVHWARRDNNSFRIALARLRLDADKALDIERRLLLGQ